MENNDDKNGGINNQTFIYQRTSGVSKGTIKLLLSRDFQNVRWNMFEKDSVILTWILLNILSTEYTSSIHTFLIL